MFHEGGALVPGDQAPAGSGSGSGFHLAPPFEDLETEHFGQDFTVINRTENAEVEIQRMIESIAEVERVPTSVFREKTLPLFYLEDLLRSRKAELLEGADGPDTLYPVVIDTSRTMAGVVVDEILGEQEIVIKSLESDSGDIKGLGGATILGDGRISLMLIVASVLWTYSPVGGLR